MSSNPSVDLLSQWQTVCFSIAPKLLKDEKGQSFIVSVNSASFSTDNAANNLPISVSFDWEQVGDSAEAILISAPKFTAR